ncbi:hypothetical protein SAMN05444000_1455 [Shimia gijangensis]|uniref:Uncharacterized protein n=1 Tax=Shimia gijangensis TaxID=1470563 RepID=A0A1M6TU22_9RHOB|nr:hypothetical protein [Shimia gijangensis]SHK60390.1 hypothetical protein SAMN05444000_1455 [Shimia gijangensis]
MTFWVIFAALAYTLTGAWLWKAVFLSSLIECLLSGEEWASDTLASLHQRTVVRLLVKGITIMLWPLLLLAGWMSAMARL